MNLIPISELFDVSYGNNLELNRLEICDQDSPDATRFVSRTNKNNGVVEYVKRISTISPNPKNTISVAASGSYVLAAFLQKMEYYSGAHLFVLHPKNQMSELEMLFYCHCITLNRFRYSYGRQANRTLGELLVPKQIPYWVTQISIENLSKNVSRSITWEKPLKANVKNWKYFSFSHIFYISKGRHTVGKNIQGDMPLISAINRNNGVIAHIFNIDEKPFPSGCIAVPMNGVSAGEAYYQREPFFATSDVNVLTPKIKISPFALLFICTIIKQEKFRFSYGRKWSKGKMETDKIKLPAKPNAEPDFEYMEDYIKSLPFSSGLDIDDLEVSKNNNVLSDKELIEKYDTGEKVNFDKALKKMSKSPSPTTLSKQKK